MMNGHWKRGLEQMVEAGIAEGTFRQDLSKDEILALLMCMMSGAAICRGDEFGTVKRGIERWLLTEEVWKATRGAEHVRT